MISSSNGKNFAYDLKRSTFLEAWFHVQGDEEDWEGAWYDTIVSIVCVKKLDNDQNGWKLMQKMKSLQPARGENFGIWIKFTAIWNTLSSALSGGKALTKTNVTRDYETNSPYAILKYGWPRSLEYSRECAGTQKENVADKIIFPFSARLKWEFLVCFR